MGTTLTVGDFHYDIMHAQIYISDEVIVTKLFTYNFGGIARANITHDYKSWEEWTISRSAFVEHAEAG